MVEFIFSLTPADRVQLLLASGDTTSSDHPIFLFRFPAWDRRLTINLIRGFIADTLEYGDHQRVRASLDVGTEFLVDDTPVNIALQFIGRR